LRLWKIPDQVLRLGILLALAAIALIVLRSRFVPESFGETGHYRGAAVEAIRGQSLKYAGSEVCVDCHDEVSESKSSSYHRSLSCEVCHGPVAIHSEDYEAQMPHIPRERGEACLACHEYLPSRPTGFPQIIESLHNPLDPCIDCHDPHDPTPPEVPESCAACHAQIARTKAVSHHLTLGCETCHEVPAEHREDPRSFLPRKPTTRDFCGSCHSTEEARFRVPQIDLPTHGGRYLCWQCHYPHFPES
jgi:ribosomal protein S27AE